MLKRTVLVLSVAVAVVCLVGIAPAQTNIDPLDDGHRHGWTENAGWMNLRGDDTNGVAVVSTSGLQGLRGYGWLENVGWLCFGDGSPDVPPKYSNTSATDFGVNMDTATGLLSGYAWGENIGWVKFAGGSPAFVVKIRRDTGAFSGSAWSENTGWLSFNGFSAAVAMTDPANVPVALSGFDVE